MKSGGYIVVGRASGLIWGIGATEAEAVEMADADLAQAGIEIVDERPVDGLGSYEERGDMEVVPATARLMARVVEHGGDCGWTIQDGVACLADEEC